MLKVQEIREIIKLIDQSSITEFTYETEGTTVSLSKGNNQAATIQKTDVAKEEPKTPEVQAVTESTKKVDSVPEETVVLTEDKQNTSTDKNYDYEVVSPMVGTFYAAPSPEEGPYVSVGSQVEPQSIVCIVEAMKLFNEIEAEVSGEIVEVVAENGELVEYGQPLFRVKKK